MRDPLPVDIDYVPEERAADEGDDFADPLSGRSAPLGNAPPPDKADQAQARPRARSVYVLKPASRKKTRAMTPEEARPLYERVAQAVAQEWSVPAAALHGSMAENAGGVREGRRVLLYILAAVCGLSQRTALFVAGLSAGNNLAVSAAIKWVNEKQGIDHGFGARIARLAEQFSGAGLVEEKEEEPAMIMLRRFERMVSVRWIMELLRESSRLCAGERVVHGPVALLSHELGALSDQAVKALEHCARGGLLEGRDGWRSIVLQNAVLPADEKIPIRTSSRKRSGPAPSASPPPRLSRRAKRANELTPVGERLNLLVRTMAKDLLDLRRARGTKDERALALVRDLAELVSEIRAAAGQAYLLNRALGRARELRVEIFVEHKKGGQTG